MQQHPSTSLRPRHSHRVMAQLLLIIVSVSVTLAQQPGIDAPSVDRLRAHISYLASDKLAGRRSGTSEADLAAEYIAGQFARYGLRRSIGIDRPGMSRLEADSPRRYMQQFPYVADVELGKENMLRITASAIKEGSSPSLNLRVGEDWMPLGFSSNSKIEALPVIFVGYGITDSALKYDDYAGEDAAGKVAIAFAGTPDGDNPHGRFARFEEVRFKAIAAREHGAKALLLIAHEDNFDADRLTSLRYDNKGDAGLPVVIISREAAKSLFSKPNLKELRNFEMRIGQAALAKVAPSAENSNIVHLDLIAFTAAISLSTDVVRRESPSFNVVGILDGSDPVLKNEAIVLGAHYDHLGHGGAGSLTPRAGEIHHGADDNASGVAGMLELARIFSAQHPRPKRTLVFIAFSGEEEGLLGSNYYVNHPIVPLASTVAMINMDMIGRLKNNNLIVGGVGTASEWRSMIEAGNRMQGPTFMVNDPERAAVTRAIDRSNRMPTGVPLVVAANGRTIVSADPAKGFALTLNEDGYGPSDHSSFYAKQVPVLFFWTGTHDDYHRPSDTAEKINYEGEVQILQLVAHIVRETAQSDKRPTFAVAKSESTGRSTGFRVYLGTIPNYAEANDGLKLDGVRDDSPAATAGLKAGDRIVKLAGREVKNVYDYTYALGEMKAGQEYQVEVMRGSERLSLKITPMARK